MHHANFVAAKALKWASGLTVDRELLEAAALTHDLNYVVDTQSDAAAGSALRRRCLKAAGFSSGDILSIERIILSASLENRRPGTRPESLEAQLLSDADTLFKALPITPIVLAHLYIRETNTELRRLADNIVESQEPLLASSTYFYVIPLNRTYGEWARTNLALWKNVREALSDPDVRNLLRSLRSRRFE